MKKIPTLFLRDPANMATVLDEVHEDCQWVLDGEGTPTRKFDGTCMMFDGTTWWARREVKADKFAPNGFEPIETDEVTGKTVGWLPAEKSSFAKFWSEALDYYGNLDAGTYELIGPKINGNPEGADQHLLIRHDDAMVVRNLVGKVTFPMLRDALSDPGFSFEGVVWHHPDGRMAKLKKRDFEVSE